MSGSGSGSRYDHICKVIKHIPVRNIRSLIYIFVTKQILQKKLKKETIYNYSIFLYGSGSESLSQIGILTKVVQIRNTGDGVAAPFWGLKLWKT